MNLDPQRAVLNLALALTWVRETQGPNRGEVVDRMLRRVGLEPGQPWCAAYVAWCGWAVLRSEWPLPLVGGCASLGAAAKAAGLLRQAPAPGAVFLLWSEQLNRYRHTGFLTVPERDRAWGTVEGNTSPDGSPEGTGVFVRVRRFNPLDRFIYWWEQPATAPAAPGI